MLDVAAILAGDFHVHLFHIVVTLAGLNHPLVEMLHQELEVADTVVAGLDVVVAKILSLVGGVDGTEELLGAELIHRVAGMLGNPAVEHGFLGLGGRGVLDETIAPANGIEVVDAHLGGRELHATLQVTGLSYVVVAGVVHDTGRGAILLGELRVAELLDGEGIAGTHIVHQAEGVAHLMGGGILHRLAHHVVVELQLAHALVDGAGLDEAPVVEQRHDVMIPDDVGGQNLARAGVYIAGTHGIGRRRSHIAEAVAVQVVGVKRGIVLGIIQSFDGVLETGTLEGAVPHLDTVLDGLAPLGGEGGVYVEDDGRLWLYQLATEIAVTVLGLGLQAPAVDIGAVGNAVGIGAEDALVGIEIAHAVVLQAHGHGLIGQGDQRAAHLDAVGLLDSARELVRQQCLYLDVALKGLDEADTRGL